MYGCPQHIQTSRATKGRSGSIELIPRGEALQKPVGLGREKPNQFPFPPTPVRPSLFDGLGIDLTFNPFCTRALSSSPHACALRPLSLSACLRRLFQKHAVCCGPLHHRHRRARPLHGDGVRDHVSSRNRETASGAFWHVNRCLIFNISKVLHALPTLSRSRTQVVVPHTSLSGPVPTMAQPTTAIHPHQVTVKEHTKSVTLATTTSNLLPSPYPLLFPFPTT